MITIKDLEDNDYDEYQIDRIIINADRFFQKRVVDRKGIKYFINAYIYEKLYNEYNIEFEVYFNEKKDGYSVVVKTYCIDKDKTLKDIEKFYQKMFKRHNFIYYERK